MLPGVRLLRKWSRSDRPPSCWYFRLRCPSQSQLKSKVFSIATYLKYAIPDDGAAPSLADVNALIAAYSVRGRKPRLEYVAKLAPAVEETLISAGFTVEGRLPLMTCTPGSEKLLPLPPDIELIVPVSEAEILGTAAAQHEESFCSSPSFPKKSSGISEPADYGIIFI